MEKVRKELRDKLFELRMKLQLIKMERIENDERVLEIQNEIDEVRKQIKLEFIESEEKKRNGKTI